MMTAAAFAALAACGGEQLTTEPPTASASSRLIYLDGEGIEACGPSPIARDLWLELTPAAVDAAQGALVATPAELAIVDADGNPVPFEPLGERFRTRFVRSGTYVLTATFGAGEQVTREVTVVERAGVRLGQKGAQVVTHGASSDCTLSVSEGTTPLLSLNQELRTWIVPVDAQDRPLLGALELEFFGTASARKWMPESPLNSYVLQPTRSGTNVLTIRDTGLQLERQVSFEAEAAPAECPAP